MTYYVRLRIGYRTFDVRRELLLRESEYFQVALSGKWGEVAQHEVELKGHVPTEKAAKVIFDFLETRKLVLQEEDVEEVVMAADFLQIASVFSALQELMTLDNWTEFLKLAEIFPQLKNTVYQFLGDRYLLVLECEQFGTLSSTTKDYIKKLPLQNRTTTICVIGSDLQVLYYHDNDSSWERLTYVNSYEVSVRDFVESGSAVAVGHRLFVLGRNNRKHAPFVKSIKVYDKFVSYNTKTDEWTDCEALNMTLPHRDNIAQFCLVNLRDCIYAFGVGVNHKYCPDEDRWVEVSEPPVMAMPYLWSENRFLQTPVVSCSDNMYVLCRNSEKERCLIRYDSSKDEWNEPRLLPNSDNATFTTLLSNDTDVYLLNRAKCSHTSRRAGRDVIQQIFQFNGTTGSFTLKHKLRYRGHSQIGKSHCIVDDKLYRFDDDKTVCFTLPNMSNESHLPRVPNTVVAALGISVPRDFLY
ncbi:uncharacterized protein LOC144350395 [Saccoglossus kowalevskii]